MLSKKLNAFFEAAKQKNEFWIEKAKLDFAMQLNSFRKVANLSNKELANKLGTSAGYVSKVFRGESNLTIESMVKAARAVDSELHITLVSKNHNLANWIDKLPQNNSKPFHVSRSSGQVKHQDIEEVRYVG